VEHAHQRGIIHRDLKPANLMVANPEGDEACLKVIDFGVAAAIRAGLEQHTGLTLQGQVLGTPGYLAPERLLDGTRDSGALADVYSLGAVLYEVLAGRPAFALEGKGTAAAIATVLREQPARLGVLNRWLRGDLEAIAATAMKSEPGERYQSVAELRRDVERHLAGRPVTARMPGPAYIAWKFVGRHRVLTGVCAAAALVAGAAQWQAQEAKRDGCELAAEIAGSWLEHTVRMARTIGERDKRRPFLERLAQESERFEALAPNDVRILKIHTGVLGSLGDVAEEEGRYTEAAVLVEEARELRERIMQVAPGDLDAEMDRSVAVVRCGDLASHLGDPTKAEACYERAMDLDRGILARASKNARAVNNLAWSCHRLGVRAIGHDLDRAEMLLNEGLGLMIRADQVRGSVDDVRGVADMHLQLASVAKARGDGGRATPASA
jgi:tetratricopeptide (TPR) repeat protein